MSQGPTSASPTLESFRSPRKTLGLVGSAPVVAVLAEVPVAGGSPVLLALVVS